MKQLPPNKEKRYLQELRKQNAGRSLDSNDTLFPSDGHRDLYEAPVDYLDKMTKQKKSGQGVPKRMQQEIPLQLRRTVTLSDEGYWHKSSGIEWAL